MSDFETQDLTPAMIGQRIRIHHGNNLNITGRLNNLDVLTERNVMGVHSLTGVIVQLDDHELHLTGHENVTTLDH